MAKRLLIEILQPWRLRGRRLWERGGREVKLQLNVSSAHDHCSGCDLAFTAAERMETDAVVQLALNILVALV